MVRFEVEKTARMRRFPVDRHAEVGALSLNFRIEKRQLPVFSNLHSELNCWILLVEVVQSCLQCVTHHDSESVIDEAKPQSWTIGHGGDGVALQVLHEDIGYHGRDWRSHGETVRHLIEFFAELERCVLQGDCQKLDNGGDWDWRLEFP